MNLTLDLATVVTALGALSLTIIGFFSKRWMDRVERKLDATDQKVTAALIREAREGEKLEASIELARSNTEAIGNLRAAVEKLFIILEAKGLNPGRMSDVLKKTTGG